MGHKYFRLRDLANAPATEKRPAREGRVNASGATIWRWTAAGTFPKPVKLSNGITAWLVEAVEQWERDREAAAPGNTEQRADAGRASVAARRAKKAAEVSP
jgi:predicted DNA-binding transcriptional regulator AlpA